MRNREGRKTVLGFLTAGLALLSCSAACAAWGGMPPVYRGILCDAGAEKGTVSPLARMLEKAKEQEAAVTGEDPAYLPDSRFVVSSRTENDIRVMSMAGQCLADDGREWVFYAVGRDYMPEGSVLPAIFGQRLEYSCTLEDQAEWKGEEYYAVRFALKKIDAADQMSGYRPGESGQIGGNGQDGTGGQTGGSGQDGTGGQSGGSGQDGTGGQTGGSGQEGAGEQSGGSGQDSAGGQTGGNEQAGGNLARKHWDIGDVVTRKLDGITYRFRCIDQNYGEGLVTGQSLALFLCDSVIPANTGSKYVYEQLEDGSFGYVFYPGPIVNFGRSQEYADSSVRAWLKEQEEESDLFPSANVGVEKSYTGQTEPGSFSRFEASSLRSVSLGTQILFDHYFILSVDEALKYREYLWKTEGLGEEETAGSASAFAKGYWLRTPVGVGSFEGSGCVYVVDLVNGNIHPQMICPQADGEDEELDVTGPVGVRPAFVLRQTD